MAGGDWLQIDLDLPEKPEVQLIVAKSGESIDVVCGRLLLFWRWVERHAGKAEVPDVDAQVLAQLCGGKKEFWEIVGATRWLKFTDTGIRIEGYNRRFSKSAKRRILDARRQKKKYHADLTHGREEKREIVDLEQEQEQELKRANGQGAVLKKNGTEFTAKDLASNQAMCELQSILAAAGHHHIDAGHDSLRHILEAAEHVRERVSKPRRKPIRDPIGLFFSIIHSGKWNFTNGQCDRAAKRHSETKRAGGSPAGPLAKLAAGYSGRTDAPPEP